MCDEFKELISLYIDGELDQDNEKILMNHIENCSDCQSYYNEIKNMVEDLNNLDQLELPDNFHNEAMARIRNISKPSVEKRFLIPFTKYASAAACFAFLLTAFVVAGSFIVKPSDSSLNENTAALQQVMIARESYDNGSSKEAYNGMIMDESDTVADMAGEQIFYVNADEAVAVPNAASSQDRLILAPEVNVRESSALMSSFYYIEIQSKQFDLAMDIIDGLTVTIANSNVYYGTMDSRTANFSMNITDDNVDTVLEVVRSLGEVTSESNYSSALKQQYDDATIRLSAKEQERLRLLNLMEKTKTMENLILLETRLSQVEAEIDGLNGSIKGYVQTSDNSNLILVINEKTQPIITYENKDFLQRVRGGFITSINITINFFEGLLVFIAGSIIPLCIAALIGGFGFMAYKLSKRREHKY